MSGSPPALLIDDGELKLVHALLGDIGVEFWHLRGSKIEPPIPFPRRLLITSARLAVALPLRRARIGDGSDPIWMAFVQGDSRTQRQLLRRAGFDYLIPEPVHPAALRLLMMRAVFEGANTQDVERVAFGDQIRFATLLRSYPAVLIDISPRGCRLMTRKAPKLGAKISVQIPPEGACGRPLALDGIVTRTRPAEAEGGSRDETAVGVRFRPMKRTQALHLKEVLEERRSGPRTLIDPDYAAGPATSPTLALGSLRALPTREPDRKPERKPEPQPDPELAPAREPEGLPRAVYEASVEAFCAGATRLLVGRDISEKGMLVERNARLKVGERVRVFLHGAAREEPMLIEAHVARDDGARGHALHFDWLEPAALERLRRLIQGLPKVRRLDEDTKTNTAVLAELLPQLKRRG